MLKQIILSSFFLFSTLTGWSADTCLSTLVQIKEEETNTPLSEEELDLVEALLHNLGDISIAAIYTANSPRALELANILSDAYKCPVTVDDRLRKLLPKTLFKRVGEIRAFGLERYNAYLDEEVIIISDESFVNFIGKYTEGGFTKIQDFQHVKVDFDGDHPSKPL